MEIIVTVRLRVLGGCTVDKDQFVADLGTYFSEKKNFEVAQVAYSENPSR